MTLKELRKLTEGMPDSTEVTFLLAGDNPVSEAWAVSGALDVGILGSNIRQVVLTHEKIAKFN